MSSPIGHFGAFPITCTGTDNPEQLTEHAISTKIRSRQYKLSLTWKTTKF